MGLHKHVDMSVIITGKESRRITSQTFNSLQLRCRTNAVVRVGNIEHYQDGRRRRGYLYLTLTNKSAKGQVVRVTTNNNNSEELNQLVGYDGAEVNLGHIYEPMTSLDEVYESGREHVTHRRRVTTYGSTSSNISHTFTIDGERLNLTYPNTWGVRTVIDTINDDERLGEGRDYGGD